MLFLGFPVELQEAYRILGAAVTIKEENYDYGAELSEYLQPHGVDIYYIDQGVCVLGRKLDDALIGMHLSVLDFNDYVWTEAADIVAKLRAVGANLSRIRISFIREDSKVVTDAKPMVLIF